MALFLKKNFAKNPEFRTPPFAEQVPIATVRDGVYVLTDGTLVSVFRIKGLEYDLAGNQEKERYSMALRSILNATPPEVQIKFLHRISHNYSDVFEEHEKEITGTNPFPRYLAWEYYRRLYQAAAGGELLRSDNLIAIAYNPRIKWWEADDKVTAVKEAVTSLASSRSVLQRTVENYRTCLSKYEEIISQFYDQLRLAGMDPHRLDDEGLYRLAWEILNPRISMLHGCPKIRMPATGDPYTGLFARGRLKKEAEKNPSLTVVAPISEREQLCASDWMVGDKWVRLDDVYYGCIYVRVLPERVYAGLALALARLPFESTISVDAYMLQKRKELERQWAATKRAKGLSELTFTSAITDPNKQREFQEQQDAYMELASGSENMFRFRMVIALTAPDPKTLQSRCNSVITLLRNMENMEGIREHYGVDTLLKTTWPFYPITDICCRKALTSQIADMTPAYSPATGSPRPVTLLMDEQNRLISHDPFPMSTMNRNRLVCGKSGSGKSFATQLADVLPHLSRAGVEVLIVESGASFLLTTELCGGVYLKLGPSCKYRYNPFDLPQDFDLRSEGEKEEQLNYKFGFIKMLMMTFARIVEPKEQMIAESVIGTIVARLYTETKKPLMRDFYRLVGQYRNPRDQEAEKMAGRLLTLLAPYTTVEGGDPGIYAHYFDCETNFDVENTIMCFDMMDVKKDEALLGPMCLVFMNGLIYNRIMRRDGIDRYVVLDEAWALVKSKNGEETPAGKAIELFYRECRKLGAAVNMISQNISDMTGGSIGQAVFANAEIQYYLVHKSMVQNTEAFRSQGWGKEQIERVYGLQTVYGEYSEIIKVEGEATSVVRLPSSGMRYWLATTAPKDLEVRKRYWKTYVDGYRLTPEAVIAILAQDYPGGVAAPHGDEMGETEAVGFAEHWQDHYRRFCERVAAGQRIPPDFE